MLPHSQSFRLLRSRSAKVFLKHFAVNNQKSRRMTIDTVADERATPDQVRLTGIERVYNVHDVHNVRTLGSYIQSRLVERLSEGAA